jgi:hypothetical protein
MPRLLCEQLTFRVDLALNAAKLVFSKNGVIKVTTDTEVIGGLQLRCFG